MSKPPFPSDPLALFRSWFAEAKACRAIEQPEAMCLSTTGLDDYPDGRMVLLKAFDERGFVFFTNLGSLKARSLAKRPRAGLTFHWDPLKRQIRIQGDTEIISDKEADAYWVTRPRLAQIGAWASRQSEVLKNNWEFIRRLTEYGAEFGTKPVPRPPFWGGIRVKPFKIEFWRARRGRLHERVEYYREGSRWVARRLYP